MLIFVFFFIKVLIIYCWNVLELIVNRCDFFIRIFFFVSVIILLFIIIGFLDLGLYVVGFKFFNKNFCICFILLVSVMFCVVSECNVFELKWVKFEERKICVILYFFFSVLIFFIKVLRYSDNFLKLYYWICCLEWIWIEINFLLIELRILLVFEIMSLFDGSEYINFWLFLFIFGLKWFLFLLSFC